jgi:hypothetical protein
MAIRTVNSLKEHRFEPYPPPQKDEPMNKQTGKSGLIVVGMHSTVWFDLAVLGMQLPCGETVGQLFEAYNSTDTLGNEKLNALLTLALDYSEYSPLNRPFDMTLRWPHDQWRNICTLENTKGKRLVEILGVSTVIAGDKHVPLRDSAEAQQLMRVIFKFCPNGYSNSRDYRCCISLDDIPRVETIYRFAINEKLLCAVHTGWTGRYTNTVDFF